MDGLITPCYVIDADTFKDNLNDFKKEFTNSWSDNIIFGYSVKTNNNTSFLKLALRLHMFAEVVSDDEYYLSQSVGYAPSQIIYNGPQKTRERLIKTLKSNSIVNLDNFSEIKWIQQDDISLSEIRAKVGLRINFDLEKLCPGETTAGEEVSRFGFCIENGDLDKAIDLLHKERIKVSGFHLHYSSKSRSVRIYEQLVQKVVDVIKTKNLIDEIEFIDIGGGFFYGKNSFSVGKPQLCEYSNAICPILKEIINPDNTTLILEPGASLISTAVTYYTKIINERNIRDVVILTTDGSLLDINPFMAKREVMYQIDYQSALVERGKVNKQIVVGSTCMENDRFFTLINKRKLLPDDIVKCECVGAYTIGFNSCFINLPPRIYLKQNNKLCLVREKNLELLSLL